MDLASAVSKQSVHLQDRTSAEEEVELAHNEREALLRKIDMQANEIRQMRRETARNQ